MNSFVCHEPCPKCGSKDNLGVWEDGHKWCFGCGFFKPSVDSLLTVEKKFMTRDTNNSLMPLPRDCTTVISGEALQWLNSYGITPEERSKNNMLWSPVAQMLIFPFFDEEQLIAWQGRYFPKRKAKCFTQGDVKDLLILLGQQTDKIVLVEDMISAIKVARVGTSMPLLGSHLSLEKAIRLSKMFKEVIFWLDPDKANESSKMSKKYNALFDGCDVIVTEKDPKEYSTEEIKEKLNDRRY